MVDINGPQMTIWRMHFSCWITKATNTHSVYVLLTVFFCCTPKNCYAIAPVCHVIRTSHVFLTPLILILAIHGFYYL